MFDSGGPDNVQLCLIISELSLEFGLHMEPPVDLVEEEKDRRRILFWAIYAQERARECMIRYVADRSGRSPLDSSLAS